MVSFGRERGKWNESGKQATTRIQSKLGSTAIERSESAMRTSR